MNPEVEVIVENSMKNKAIKQPLNYSEEPVTLA